MNIAFISIEISGSKNTTPIQRSTYLSREHNVLFFVRNNVSKELFPQATKIYRCPGIIALFYPLWVVLKIWCLNNKMKIDLVYTTRSPEVLISGFLLQRLGFKWVADIWDVPDLRIKVLSAYGSIKYRLHWGYSKFIYLLAKRVLKYADLIVWTLSPKLLNQYGIKRVKNVLSLTNGTDLSIANISYISEPEIDRENEFLVTYVGWLRKIRGIDTLIETANDLKDKIFNLRFVLVGYTNKEDREWLNSEIDNNNLYGIVEFIGEVSHKEALGWINIADVCVYPFPAKKELNYIYPIKIFEYMALGKAIVASNLPGVAEIIEDGKNGLLVEPSSYQAMSKAILKIYKDNNLRNRLENEAKKKVKRFDWECINNRLNRRLTSIR